MDHSEQMKQLMERLEIIEQKLNYISLTSVQKLDGYHIENITIGNNCKLDMQNCSAGNITIGNNGRLNLPNCSIGAIIDTDIEDAECRLDDLESRLVKSILKLITQKQRWMQWIPSNHSAEMQIISTAGITNVSVLVRS